MKIYTATVFGLLFMLACGGSEPGADDAAQTTPQEQTETEQTVTDPDTGNEVTANTEEMEDFAKGLKVTLENEEGERRTFPAEIEVTETGRYVMYPWQEEAQITWENLNIVNDKLEKVELPKDVVTLVEYWSADALDRNQYWSTFRQLEQEYAGSDELKLISIQHDSVLSGKAQVQQAQAFLENYTRPATLYYDLDDGLRDRLPRMGPVAYYLIDHRGQLTHLARGDAPVGAEVFEAVENALKYQEAVRTGKHTNMSFEFNTDEDSQD